MSSDKNNFEITLYAQCHTLYEKGKRKETVQGKINYRKHRKDLLLSTYAPYL